MSLEYILPAECCGNNIEYIPEQGCRNGQSVYRFFVLNKSSGAHIVNDASPDGYFYEDEGTNLLPTPWTQGPCTSISLDPEVVTVTNDGGETKIKAVIVYDTSTNPPTAILYDPFVGTVLTGYTLVEETSQRVIEGEARCDSGAIIVPFYDVETDGTASANIAFWFNPVTNAVVIPSGSQTYGSCTTAVTSALDGYQNLGNGTYASIVPSNTVEIRYDTYKNGFVPSAGDVTVLVVGAMVGNKTYTIVPNTSRTIKLATNDIVSVTISGAVNNTLEVLFIN